MSLAIAGLTAEQGMAIADAACVDTSFPGFDSTLGKLLGGVGEGA
jgi:5-enolpyruvylshikimate-3-phosphate synthase